MNKELIKNKIEEAVNLYNEMIEIDNKIYDLFGNGDSKFNDITGKLFDVYLTQLEMNLHSDDFISWFIFENNCGKKKLKMFLNNKEYVISNIDELVNFLIEYNKEE